MYEGWFKNGLFNGVGKFLRHSIKPVGSEYSALCEEIYEGSFKDGEFDGRGKWVKRWNHIGGDDLEN